MFRYLVTKQRSMYYMRQGAMEMCWEYCHRTFWDKIHELYKDNVSPSIDLKFWSDMCLTLCKIKFQRGIRDSLKCGLTPFLTHDWPFIVSPHQVQSLSLACVLWLRTVQVWLVYCDWGRILRRVYMSNHVQQNA